MGRFIKRYNDYSCIKKNDTEDIVNLSHYTSSADALINICSGEFWATDITDFGDKNEGKLILYRIKETVLASNLFTDAQKNHVQNLIGNDNGIDKFISEHRTAVLSMSLNTDSKYMWEYYARENGYNIIFDKKKFLDGLHFFTSQGEKKDGEYLKHSKIMYSQEEQDKIINEEIRAMLSANEFGFDEQSKIEYILRHLMYVGNFYKKEQDLDVRYADEQEYRILVNTSVPTEKYPEIVDLIPKYYLNDKNEKHYNILKFDRNAIKTIVCNSEQAKSSIEEIITDIPIVLRSNI